MKCDSYESQMKKAGSTDKMLSFLYKMFFHNNHFQEVVRYAAAKPILQVSFMPMHHA